MPHNTHENFAFYEFYMIYLADTSSDAALTGKRIPYVSCLDGVRAVSILLVLLAHTAPLGPKPWLLNAMAGRMGMALFSACRVI